MLYKIFSIIIFSANIFFAQINYHQHSIILEKPNTVILTQNKKPISQTSHTYLFPEIIGSIALTQILLATDSKTYNSMQKIKMGSHFVKNVSPIITQIGDGKFSIALFGSMGLYYFASKNKKIGDAALLGIESFLLSGITVQILKHTFGRERPSHKTLARGKWSGPFILSKKKSIANFDAFPSGHTATVFAAASSLSYVYSDGIMPYVFYSIATLVAVSRVIEDTHWFSDCFVGGLIGYLSTQLINYLHNRDSMFSVGFIERNNSYSFVLSISL